MDKVVELVKRYNKKYLYIALILLLLVIILALTYPKDTQSNDIKTLDEVSNDYEVAKIEVDTKPILFATTDNENINYYYFINKDNNKIYIALIDNAVLKNISDNKISIVGSAIPISDKIKEISMEFYNKNVDDRITDENYNDYFGSYYLGPATKDNDSRIYLYLMLCLGIILILSTILYIKNKIITKKTLNKISNNYARIENNLKKAYYYSKMRIIITKEYLILLNCNLNIIDFNDIIWIYEDITKKHIFRKKESMILYTKDKSYLIRNVEKAKKDGIESIELFKLIKKKCPNLMKKEEFIERY